MKLMEIYHALMKHFGEQRWWPVDREYHRRNKSDERVEILIGAILTQNTAWSNVEKCLISMKNRGLMDIEAICNADIHILQDAIRQSGFYRQKAERLKNFMCYIDSRYNSNLDRMFSKNGDELREELLSIKGIGRETADSILLYAANKTFFVIDAYTKRLVERLGITSEKDYEKLRLFFEKNVKKDVEVYKEFHALIVELCKNYCKKIPLCDGCPLKDSCMYHKSKNK